MKIVKSLMNFIDNSPNCFEAVLSTKAILLENGFEELSLDKVWNLSKGGSYFTIKNDSSIICFKIGKNIVSPKIKMVASHNDSPTFKIKPLEMIVSADYTRFNTEPYGGILMSTWMDRLVGVAGRVIVNDNGTLVTKIVNLKEKNFIIPSLAIHLNREAGTNPSFNAQVDTLPLVSMDNLTIEEILKEELDGKKIMAHDLFLYNKDKASLAGANNELICAPKLDDLECAYISLDALINSDDDDNINICAIFNNEEVGSNSNNGAGSTFLNDVVCEIINNFNLNKRVVLASSFLVSADNAHAIHPNHPEKSDPVNNVKINKGIVIKYNAGLSYTTDGYSAAVFKDICDKINVPIQNYTNRSDMRGGGTLGYVLLSKLSVNSVDIGLPQLAMHSSFETAGVKDIYFLHKALVAYYNN